MGNFSKLSASLPLLTSASKRKEVARLLTATQTNDNAAAGDIGEYVESLVPTGSAVSLATSGVAVNVTSISLTAGDWDVEGMVVFKMKNAIQTGDGACGITTTSAVLPADGMQGFSGLRTAAATTYSDSCTIARRRFSLAAPTTIYLVALTVFTAGTNAAFGGICARRVR